MIKMIKFNFCELNRYPEVSEDYHVFNESLKTDESKGRVVDFDVMPDSRSKLVDLYVTRKHQNN